MRHVTKLGEHLLYRIHLDLEELHGRNYMETNQTIPIYTIGYGQRTITNFIRILQQHDIRYLVDVRTAPYSRYQPDFTKDKLHQALSDHDIRYLFLGKELGGMPADDTCYSGGKVDYDLVKTRAFYQAGLARIQKAFDQQQRVVLMCSEGKPESCHRTKLIGESLTALDIPILHIDEKDELQPQDVIIDRITGGQLSLFGDHQFHSRKQYT